MQYRIGDQKFPDLASLLAFYKCHYLDTTPLVRPAPKRIEKVTAKYDFEGRVSRTSDVCVLGLVEGVRSRSFPGQAVSRGGVSFVAATRVMKHVRSPQVMLPVTMPLHECSSKALSYHLLCRLL